MLHSYRPSAVSISGVRTVRVQTVCSVRTLTFLGAGMFFVVGSMSVHIRQSVREQPDTWILETAEGR
jgi:hypothetical protein